VSFQIACQSQDEIDYYWKSLGQGGEEGPCGWLKDKFGLSWQVTPEILPDMLADYDSERSQRAMTALRSMSKLDIAALKAAYAGQPS
jgi:predicted 3-demethylubiquinone-9 3-methyltransferase (glyoxalase superfamily)